MADNIFYVYELIDPRTDTPFYVGKGCGARINNYFKQYPKVNDYTRTVLEEIAMSGYKLEIKYVKEKLTELEAIQLERELIKKYGRLMKDPGGLLTNVRASDHTRLSKGISAVKNNKKYTTIQITKDINLHIKNFCKKYNVNASTITELMWTNYISSSTYLTEIMTMAEPARSQLISSSMSGSITL